MVSLAQHRVAYHEARVAPFVVDGKLIVGHSELDLALASIRLIDQPPTGHRPASFVNALPSSLTVHGALAWSPGRVS
jgi:hypothetical protein